MTALPRISIVVPNYNGGATIGATLESLLAQKYPDLEIIVMDGGSKDNSVEIIKQYEKHLTYWQSAKDNGQSDAINQGFARATGEILNWLCSDDLQAEGALLRVGEEFARNPELDVLSGWAHNIHYERTNEKTAETDDPVRLRDLDLIPAGCPVAQPSTFYRRRTLDRPGPIDVSYHYLMDMELWAYFRKKKYCWQIVDKVLSVQIISGFNKSMAGRDKIIGEAERLYKAYTHDWIPMCWWHQRFIYPVERWRGRKRNTFRHVVAQTYKAIVFSMLCPFYGMRRLRAMNWSVHSRSD
jgi:glycosyltransferase involved in cell wall biosynthesis